MSKKRDKEHRPKPHDVPLKREELPQSPAKMRSGYCKKAKAEHEFEFDDVHVHKMAGYPQGRFGPCCIVGLWHLKTYRCSTCGKKKLVSDRQMLDVPVPLKRETIIMNKGDVIALLIILAFIVGLLVFSAMVAAIQFG